MRCCLCYQTNNVVCHMGTNMSARLATVLLISLLLLFLLYADSICWGSSDDPIERAGAAALGLRCREWRPCPPAGQVLVLSYIFSHSHLLRNMSVLPSCMSCDMVGNTSMLCNIMTEVQRVTILPSCWTGLCSYLSRVLFDSCDTSVLLCTHIA